MERLSESGEHEATLIDFAGLDRELLELKPFSSSQQQYLKSIPSDTISGYFSKTLHIKVVPYASALESLAKTSFVRFSAADMTVASNDGNGVGEQGDEPPKVVDGDDSDPVLREDELAFQSAPGVMSGRDLPAPMESSLNNEWSSAMQRASRWIVATGLVPFVVSCDKKQGVVFPVVLSSNCVNLYYRCGFADTMFIVTVFVNHVEYVITNARVFASDYASFDGGVYRPRISALFEVIESQDKLSHALDVNIINASIPLYVLGQRTTVSAARDAASGYMMPIYPTEQKDDVASVRAAFEVQNAKRTAILKHAENAMQAKTSAGATFIDREIGVDMGTAIQSSSHMSDAVVNARLKCLPPDLELQMVQARALDNSRVEQYAWLDSLIEGWFGFKIHNTHTRARVADSALVQEARDMAFTAFVEVLSTCCNSMYMQVLRVGETFKFVYQAFGTANHKWLANSYMYMERIPKTNPGDVVFLTQNGLLSRGAQRALVSSIVDPTLAVDSEEYVRLVDEIEIKQLQLELATIEAKLDSMRGRKRDASAIVEDEKSTKEEADIEDAADQQTILKGLDTSSAKRARVVALEQDDTGNE